jgi:RNA polymerase sigma-70 factor (ECF subfamily)
MYEEMPRDVSAHTGLFSTWRHDRSRLVSRARRRVGSTADAEDVVQDAAIAALVHAGELRDGGRANAWVARIVDRKATDVARAHGRQERVRGNFEEAGDVMAESAGPPCFCVRVQARRLRPVYAEVLERVDARGESIASVAAALGVTTNALTVRLSRARALLRDTLRAHCGTTAPQSCADCGCLERRCCSPVDQPTSA